MHRGAARMQQGKRTDESIRVFVIAMKRRNPELSQREIAEMVANQSRGVRVVISGARTM